MYVSLHNRSAYSFGLALTMPGELAAFAAANGMPAIALTDRDGLYAAVEFQQACEKAGVKPIFGTELEATWPLVRASVPAGRAGEDSRGGWVGEGILPPTETCTIRLTLLARNLAGYSNLCRLISLRQLRGAPLDEGDLREFADGLICLLGQGLSACSTPESVAPANSRCDGWTTNPIHSACLALRGIFPGRLYVELVIHGGDDVPVARRRARMADELGIPVVATCDSRCLRREQALTLQALTSIGTLTLLEEPHFEKPAISDQRSDFGCYLRTAAEMAHLFARRPDALANTLRIAGQCDVRLDLSRNRFPPFASPDGRGAIEHLRELAVAGCRRRYVDEPPLRGIGGRRATLAEALERLERELSIIEQVHYAEYFLVFHEINQECRRRGIATLARGSAADSLVCYALGVSHACPFRFDLPFDRFINPERARFSKMADIDLDLPWDQRDEIIRWVCERWGADRVAMIGCPNTFHARAAVADLGKVYGLPPSEIYRLTRLLPHVTAANLEASIARSPEARGELMGENSEWRRAKSAKGLHSQSNVEPAENSPFAIRHSPFQEPYRTIFRLARELDDLPRHWAMHPCGLVVSPEPLTDLVPVQRSPKGILVTQYDMDAIENLGFVKIDLLGQAGLSVLRDAVESINSEWRMANSESTTTPEAASGGESNSLFAIRYSEFDDHPPVDLARDVDYSDAATWDMIARGHARGVHHIESPAMTSLLQQCNCRDIDCLTAVVAIIRPGAANQGRKEAFARRHQGMEPSSFVHPAVRPALEKTYGLMVFEEHILQVATEFAGMNLGRADVLRRALNKENHAMIAELRGEFRAEARQRGRTEAEIAAVWGQVEGFCGFMFNKAHSAEYAVEAFQGAWLKLRWPAHYIAAILSNYRGFYASSSTLPQIMYVMEARRLGIGFLPPCVNRSRRKFSVERSAVGKQRSAMPAGAGIPSRTYSAIRVPVSHIRGLSEQFLARFLAERDRGEFGSLRDFVERCRPGEAESLALLDSGALDALGESRPAMFWELRRLSAMRGRAGGNLWGHDESAEKAPPPIDFTRPDIRAVARREMELLGFPIAIDPLTWLGTDDTGRAIDWSRYTPVARLHRHHRRTVHVCGLMVADRINATTKGELMKFVTLADHTGSVEALLFPDVYQRFGHLTAAHPILAARAVVEPFENHRGHTLRVIQVSPPVRLAPGAARGMDRRPPNSPRPHG